jgi:hypothetical protein
MLRIQANTNAVGDGGSVIITCQITNVSTNISFKIEAYPLFLTDGAGKVYIPPQLHSPSWDQTSFFPSYYNIGPGESRQWTLMFTIDKSLPQGSCEIKTRRTMFFGSTNVFGGSRKLESNALRVEIR